jgi:hypothetical protein
MKLMMTLAVLLPLLSMPCAFAGDSATADQQEKDFEQKQRIYGTKHPWENTNPYGTQYTPPQAGGASGDVAQPDSEKDKTQTIKSAKSAKPAQKPAAHKVSKSKRLSAGGGSVKPATKKTPAAPKPGATQAH